MKLPSLNQLIAAAAVIISGLALWTFWPRDTPDIGVSAPLPPAKEVRTVEKIKTDVKVVYVYPDKVKEKLDLPAPVVADETKKVTATGKLDAQERPYTLSAVLDTETGQSEVYARPDPLPWIGPGRRGAVGMAYGLHNGHTDAKLYAQHDLLQVKAIHAGARAEIDQRGEYWAGWYVEYRF
jgi:hypothetical protein